jgi:GNAT superfamily N-acetyltransferase
LYDVIGAVRLAKSLVFLPFPSYRIDRVQNDPQVAGEYFLTEPQSDADWQRYFDLRWRILRAPWNQPRGSERDERENESIHLMVCDASRAPFAIGRMHFNSLREAQIRFMAVEPEFAGRGFGSQILSELESRALARGARRAVLNARKEASRFYLKHGYVAVGSGDTLFGVVEHVRMEKELSSRKDRQKRR